MFKGKPWWRGRDRSGLVPLDNPITHNKFLVAVQRRSRRSGVWSPQKRYHRDELPVFCCPLVKHVVFANYTMRQTAVCCHPSTAEYYRTGRNAFPVACSQCWGSSASRKTWTHSHSFSICGLVTLYPQHRGSPCHVHGRTGELKVRHEPGGSCRVLCFHRQCQLYRRPTCGISGE